MRKWIVEETNEKRSPITGEYFLCEGKIIPAYITGGTTRSILRVTEITDKIVVIIGGIKIPSFDEWNW